MIKVLFSRKWILALLIICSSIIYFLFRIANLQFLDGVFGNLFATILGVIFGVPIGLEINRVQQETQNLKDKAQNEQEQIERLKSLLRRIQFELNENRNSVGKIRDIFDDTISSRLEFWEWSIAISSSFTFDAYQELLNSNIERKLWHDLDGTLYLTYTFLNGLKHRALEGKAAHLFYVGYKKNQKKANQELKFTNDLVLKTLNNLEETIKQIYDFRHYKK